MNNRINLSHIGTPRLVIEQGKTHYGETLSNSYSYYIFIELFNKREYNDPYLHSYNYSSKESTTSMK